MKDEIYDEEIIEPIKKEKFKLRLEARLKNALLIEAREKLGITGKKAAEKIGISYGTYMGCERMAYYPGLETQKKICNFYNDLGISLQVNDIFPQELRQVKSQKYIFSQEIPREDLIPIQYVDRRLLIDTSLEDNVDKQDLEFEINNALNTLTPREEEVLRLYFALGDEPEEQTLEEISNKYSLSRERIRGIKEKAIKRMRHASRSKNLKQYW